MGWKQSLLLISLVPAFGARVSEIMCLEEFYRYKLLKTGKSSFKREIISFLGNWFLFLPIPKNKDGQLKQIRTSFYSWKRWYWGFILSGL